MLSEQGFEPADGLHGRHALGRQQDAEFLFQGADQIDVIERIPRIDCLGTQLVGDLLRRDAQYGGDRGAKLFLVALAHQSLWPRLPTTTVIQSGIVMSACSSGNVQRWTPSMDVSAV